MQPEAEVGMERSGTGFVSWSQPGKAKSSTIAPFGGPEIGDRIS
jgi:hypothetical protein